MGVFDRLAAKVLIAFALVLIPIVAIGYTGYLENREAITKHTLDDLTLVAEAKEGHLYSFIEGVKGRAVDFSSDGFIRDSAEEMQNLGPEDPRYVGVQKDLNEHLRYNKMSIDENIHQILLMDLNGRVLAAADKRSVGKDVSGDDFFIHGRAGVYISDVSTSPHLALSKHPYHIAVAAPLTSRETGELLGVIVNFYDTHELDKILSGEFQVEMGAPTGGMGRRETLDIYIVNSEKLLVTKSQFSSGVMEQRVDTLPVRECAAGRETTAVYRNYLGSEVVGASMCVPDKGWTLLVEMSKEEALLPLALLRERAIAAIAVEIGLLTALLIVYWRGTISAVIKLSEAAKKVKSGDLTVRVEVKSKDEVGTLASDFNSMVEALGTSQEEIKKARDRLERVILSTKDAMVVIDRDYTITDANPAALEYAGVSKDEMIGKKCYDINHHKDAPCEDVICPIRDVLEKGEPMTGIIHTHFNKNGDPYIVDITASPIKDSEGNVTGVVEVARDITERREAEGELQKRIDELERMHRAFVGRELKMKELKEEIKGLEEKLGEREG